MAANPLHLLEPKDCALLLVDQQAGLAFGVGSIDRQVLLNNVVALAKTATVFGLPVVASTSATKVYSGPLMPAIKSALPGIEPQGELVEHLQATGIPERDIVEGDRCT